MASNSAAQVSIRLNTGRTPSLWRSARTSRSVTPPVIALTTSWIRPEPRELILRLNNIIRRHAAVPETRFSGEDAVSFGPFSFRADRGELRRESEPVKITEREREILTMLAQARGGNVERETLAGNGGLAAERTIDVQINRLRRKIEPDPANPSFLHTVRGVGYRLAID